MRFYLILLMLFFSACSSSVDIKDFEGKKPTFELTKYFEGSTRGWAVVQDRSGNVTRQFTVNIKGYWDDETFILDEDFLYSDGETQTRTWKIKKTGSNEFTGTASDVVGEAKGKSLGNALNWSYVLELEVDGSVYNITFDDWMFLQPDNVLINKAVMSKFGFKVGEVLIFFQKS